MYILPKSLKSIFTAWQFSGWILFKCKINRGLKIFPSVGDRIPAVCSFLPANSDKVSALYPFTVHKVSPQYCIHLQSTKFHLDTPFMVQDVSLLLHFLHQLAFHLLASLSVSSTHCDSSSCYKFPYCYRLLIFLVHFSSLTLFLPIHHAAIVTFTKHTTCFICLKPAWNW